MKKMRILIIGMALLALRAFTGPPASGADQPPQVASITVPRSGSMQILFRAKTEGPFRLQSKASMEASAPWFDITDAMITKVEPGVYLALSPKGLEDMAFYRVVSETETIAELKGWSIRVQVSAPANRQYFVQGESPVVTVTILDTMLNGVSRADFSTLNLYMYGPQAPQLTVTPIKLLNASADRAARPHHYIDLKTNPDVKVTGNVLTYPLRAVTDEAPGTYTVTVYSTLGSDVMQQIMKFADIQIGTATVENPVVTKTQCATCHEGTISKKMYMYHADVGRSPTGSWSLDYEPVKTCKACHNNDGYAAIRDAKNAYMPDPIVRRAHGVHMGEGLKLEFNTNAVTGDFHYWTHLKFPADVKNCTACHVDDRWKTAPSRMACGSCHDSVWFGAKAELPTGMVAHTGGSVTSDSRCVVCHDQDGIAEGVDVSHKLVPPAFKQAVKVAMSPPANGKFYTAGEAPKITVQIKDAATGQAINPTAIVEPLVSTNVAAHEWRRANLYVSGPRANTVPVLTTAALNVNPNAYYANNDLRVRVDKTKEDSRTTRTADSIIYQLADVAGLAPGSYTAFVEVMPSSPLGGWGSLTFQVGTTNAEPKVASRCADCHSDTRMHAGYFAVPFEADLCKSCHDNLRQTPAKTLWTTSNSGFGAAPLSRRVHGVHFGKYLKKPKEVHQIDYSNVVFPQDVRNCTKCHAETSTWAEKPSRLVCLACHDSDSAIGHGQLMTFDPTPQDAWSGDELETCKVCHGKGSAYAPNVVHSISNPYVPPYPRIPSK